MSKLTLATVANILGNPTSAATTINNNNALIITEMENTLSRDGTTPNQMNADIDLNHNDLLNVGTIHADDFTVAGTDVTGAVTAATAAAVAAGVSATAAAASATSASAYATLARDDFIVQTFTGNGSNTDFLLTADPGTANNIFVNFTGAEQFTSSFSLVTISTSKYVRFAEIVPNGLVFEVKYGYAKGVDVPAVGSVITASIANNAVDNTKLAQAAALTLKGNGTGSTANVSDLTAAQLRDLFLPTGSVIDSVTALYATNAAISAHIPGDDTIPQNTEGTQILSAVLTPKSTTNKFRIRFRGEGSASGAEVMIWAVFKNGQANALCSGFTSVSTANQVLPIHGEFEFVPGVTSSVTITVNVGTSSAGTMRLNGDSVGRYLGGTMVTSLVIEEIKV